MGYNILEEVQKKLENHKRVAITVAVFIGIGTAITYLGSVFESTEKISNFYQKIAGKSEDEKAQAAKLQAQIASLAKCKEYISKFEELLKSENTQVGLFADTESEGGQSPKIRDRNDPPGHFGLIISRDEMQLLIRETMQLKHEISPYFSETVARVVENAETFVREMPWYFVGDIRYNAIEDKGTSEEMCAKTKKEIKNFRRMLNYLFGKMEREISQTRAGTKDEKKKQGENLTIDLRKLNYGFDISIEQDLEALLLGSEQNRIQIRLNPIIPEARKMAKFEKTADYTYEAKNINKILKKGTKYIIMAVDKDKTQDEEAELRISVRSDGVYLRKGDTTELAGWVFTPPDAKTSKDLFWVAIQD
jgi:hypothetical protein